MPRALKDYNVKELMALGFTTMLSYGVTREDLMSYCGAIAENSAGELPENYSSIEYKARENLAVASVVCLVVGVHAVINNARTTVDCDSTIFNAKAREGILAAMLAIAVASFPVDYAVRVIQTNLDSDAGGIAAAFFIIMAVSYLLIHVPTSGFGNTFTSMRASFADNKTLAMSAAGMLAGSGAAIMSLDLGCDGIPHEVERKMAYAFTAGLGGAAGAGTGYAINYAFNLLCKTNRTGESSLLINDDNDDNSVASMHSKFSKLKKGSGNDDTGV